MTLADLYTELKTLGWPVAYSHFAQATAPPFITYVFAYSSDFMADNQNYKEISNIQVELYTKTKDLTKEGLLQTLLKNNRLPYQKIETYIETEDVYQVIYEIQI